MKWRLTKNNAIYFNHEATQSQKHNYETKGRIIKMMHEVFKNYQQYYTMVFSTTLMSNAHSIAYQEDMKTIISFIGNAYKSDKSFVEFAKATILSDKMMGINYLEDRRTVNAMNVEVLNYDELNDERYIMDMKCDAISELHSMATKCEGKLNEEWFDYTQIILYQPHTRFNKIRASASSGHVLLTRQTGLLYLLGIGCEQNYEKGIHRLSQCVAWGDIPSMYMLAYAYELTGDKTNSELMYEVASLAEKYLDEGYTIIPKEEEKNYSEKARNYYVFIASVKQDIVFGVGVNRIDFAFVEAMQNANIDNYDRMGYINNYERKEWKELTNSSFKPLKRAGFGFGL